MKQRLINCDFLLLGAFSKLPNKAKLLYLMLFFNADDRGFVGNADTIIKDLETNDREFDNSVSLELLQNDYKSALNDLITNGYLLEFIDNHSNHIYLVVHFFYHNKYYAKAWTNYRQFLKLVKLQESKYVLRKKGEVDDPNPQPIEQHSEEETPKSREQILKELNRGQEDDDLPTQEWSEILKKFEDKDDDDQYP